jgi:hypothetical protein
MNSLTSKITSARHAVNTIETNIVEMQARLAEYKSTLDALERELTELPVQTPKKSFKPEKTFANLVDKVKIILLEDDDTVFYGYTYLPSSDPSSFFSETLFGVKHEEYSKNACDSKCKVEEFNPHDADWRRVIIKIAKTLPRAPMLTTDQLILTMRRFLQCMIAAGGLVTWSSENEPLIELLPEFNQSERHELVTVLHELYAKSLSSGQVDRSQWTSFFLFNLMSQHKLPKAVMKPKISVFFNDVMFVILYFVAVCNIKVDQAVVRSAHIVPQYRSKHGLVSSLMHLSNNTFDYKYIFDEMLTYVGSKAFTRYIETYMSTNEASLRDKLRHLLGTSQSTLEQFNTIMCILLSMDDAKWSDKELFLLFAFIRRLPKTMESYDSIREMFSFLTKNGSGKLYAALTQYALRFVLVPEKLKSRKCTKDTDVYKWVYHMIDDQSLNPFNNKAVNLGDVHCTMLLLSSVSPSSNMETVKVHESISLKLMSLLLVLYYVQALSKECDEDVARLMIKVLLTFVSRSFPELLTSNTLYFDEQIKHFPNMDSSFVTATFRQYVKDLFETFIHGSLFLVVNNNLDDIKLQMVMSNFIFDNDDDDDDDPKSTLAQFVRLCMVFCSNSQQNLNIDLVKLVDLVKQYSVPHSPNTLYKTQDHQDLAYLISTFKYTKEDLDLLESMRGCWGTFAVTYAAAVGNINILRWLLDEEAAFGTDAMTAAAEYGHVDCMKVLVRNGVDANVEAASKAALYGHLDVLKYLHFINAPWDETVQRNAALANKKDIMQWLYENGCPWDSQTTTVAAMACNLECMQFAMDNGCPYNLKIIAFYLSESMRRVK